MIEAFTKIILLAVLVIIATYMAIMLTLTYESQREDTRLTYEILKELGEK